MGSKAHAAKISIVVLILDERLIVREKDQEEAITHVSGIK